MDTDEAAVEFMRVQTALTNMLSFMYLKFRRRKSRGRRWWVHPLNQRRIHQGDFHNLLIEMRESDPQEFSKYMRMDPAQFDIVLNLVAPFLEKNSNREPLPAALRLSITLR